MQIRKGSAEEMLRLWGYEGEENASSNARFFYRSISSKNTIFWTVDNSGELIGELYCFLKIEEDADYADGKSTAYLCAFRIRKEYRGQGLGTRLMKAALADLKQQGFVKATIGVDDSRNERFYRRMGFVTIIKDCDYDPCDRDENMKPKRAKTVFRLLSKDLQDDQL